MSGRGAAFFLLVAVATGCRTGRPDSDEAMLAGADAPPAAATGPCLQAAADAAVKQAAVDTQGTAGPARVERVVGAGELYCVDVRDDEGSYHYDVPVTLAADTGDCAASTALVDRGVVPCR